MTIYYTYDGFFDIYLRDAPNDRVPDALRDEVHASLVETHLRDSANGHTAEDVTPTFELDFYSDTRNRCAVQAHESATAYTDVAAIARNLIDIAARHGCAVSGEILISDNETGFEDITYARVSTDGTTVETGCMYAERETLREQTVVLANENRQLKDALAAANVLNAALKEEMSELRRKMLDERALARNTLIYNIKK